MAVISFPLAYVLRLGWDTWPSPPRSLVEGTVAFAVIAAVVLVGTEAHRGIWRYASVDDLLTVVRAVTLATMAFFPVLLLVDRAGEVPRSIPIIQWLVLVALIGGPRFACRAWPQLGPCPRLRREGTRSPVLLVGVGEGSALLIKAIKADASSRYRAVGILDLGAGARGRNVHGVPVLGGIDELEASVRRLGVAGLRPTRLIITERADGPLLRRLVTRAEDLGLAAARIPDLVDFRAAVDDGRIELRPVVLQELLGRPQVAFDYAPIGRLIEGRRVLVTGAGGSIGSELVRQIAGYGPGELILLDNGEFNLYAIDQEIATRFPRLRRTPLLADIRARTRLTRAFRHYRPELVFHAAALKHVPMVELNPLEGALTNVLGTRNVADAALACGALAMIQVSTDKAVNPTNVMGATKRLAEFYCQALDIAAGQPAESGSQGSRSRFMIVRFGNVLGSSGSVVPLFQKQLADGEPLTVTHPEMRRYFMTIREAVELVLLASARGMEKGCGRGEIFVLDMGEPVRIVDLARQIIRLAGKVPGSDVPIVFTGLRPGEKLREELFDSAERRLPAVVGGVLAARPTPIDGPALRRALAALGRACARGDETALRAVLARTVPGYLATDIQQEAA